MSPRRHRTGARQGAKCRLGGGDGLGDTFALRLDRIGDGAIFRDHQIDDTRRICQVDLLRARIATLCDAGIDGGQERRLWRENV